MCGQVRPPPSPPLAILIYVYMASGRPQVNGMMIEDKIVFVGPFLKRTDRPQVGSGGCRVGARSCVCLQGLLGKG